MSGLNEESVATLQDPVRVGSSNLDERRARIVARSYSNAVGGATKDELVEFLVSGYGGGFDRAVADKMAREMVR